MRFVGKLNEDEKEKRKKLNENEKFMSEMDEKESEKDNKIEMEKRIIDKENNDGEKVIKKWIKIIKYRWEEVYKWEKKREKRLKENMSYLSDLEGILEEMMDWMDGIESNLLKIEDEKLNDEIKKLESIIYEKKEFMENK